MRSTASKVLSAVKQTLTQHSASSVTVVGHGLGAAIALIDGVYLHEQLGKSASVRVVAYGMPRVGNLDFAEWVDLHLYGQVTHINNMKDPIPIVPDTGLGYRHTSGEVHITDPSTWKSCPGEFSSFSGRRARCRGFLYFCEMEWSCETRVSETKCDAKACRWRGERWIVNSSAER